MSTTRAARFIVEMDFTGEIGVDIGVVREDIEGGTYAGSQVTAVRTQLFTSVEEQLDARAEAMRRYHDDRPSEAETDAGESAVIDDYGYSETAREAFVSGYLYATDRPAPMPTREQIEKAAAEALRDVAYSCGRVWEAWQVGTMSQDDFSPAWEDDELLGSITDAVHALFQNGADRG